jgi:hypothetical protein
MPELPAVRPRALVQFLRQNGFVLDHSSESHFIYCDIMIHGLQNSLGWFGRLHRFWDWTDGFIAVTNSETDQISHVVPDSTPIEIRP